MDRSDKLLLLLIIAAVAAALFLAVGRARIEGANQSVEIILDADDARTIATASGVPPAELLADFREAGASALAIRELTLEDFVALGYVVPVASPGQANLIVPDPDFARVLAQAIAARLPVTPVDVSGPPPVISVGCAMDQLLPLPVLLREQDIRAARAAELRVVARLSNFPGASREAVEAAAAEAEAAGAHLVIFDKEEVLGYDGLIGETADALREHELLYGDVEMAAQRGGSQLARRLPSHLVRVHSISESDMIAMVPEVGIPRYARAVLERNIRACYVRLITRPQPEPMQANLEYVRGIVGALQSRGFTIGRPQPFEAPDGWPPAWPRSVIALGIAAASILLLRRLVPMAAAAVWTLFALLGIVLLLLRPTQLTPLAGIAAACTFPTLGVLFALRRPRLPRTRLSTRLVIGAALWRLLGASAISIAGGILIVGLYSRVGSLAGIEPFTGVKVSMLGPLVIVVAAVIAGLPAGAEPLRARWQRVRLAASRFFSRPVTVLEAGVILAALAALGYLLTRSGNQPVLAPAAVELKLRSFLESLLLIRPRTKEFLLGHPALMLAAAMTLRGRRGWLPLVALAAALGQASLVNTFCHFHTPLVVTALRTFNGLWLGVIVGIVALVVWRFLVDRPRRSGAT